MLVLLNGCTTIPDLPPDSELPVQQIISNSVCELRDAFLTLSERPNFRAEEWAGSISLVPKVDTDLNTTFGFSGKATLSPVHFWNWSGSPLAGVDVRGHADASATYAFHTSSLLRPDPHLDAVCARADWSRNFDHRAGLLEWWQRTIPSPDPAFAVVVPMDKQGFTRQVTVKLSGGASATYSMLPRTLSLGASGYYQRDLTLSFAFTPDPKDKKRKVVTLPEGGLFRDIKGPPTGPVSPGALQRLDAIQTENILRNLRIQPQ
jgi:hypothetical protein